RARRERVRVVHLGVRVLLHLGRETAKLAEAVEARADGAEGELGLAELVAGVAVAAGDGLRIIAVLLANARLRDLLSVLPVAQEASGRILDRRELRLLDTIGERLVQRLRRVVAAARLLHVVLVEPVERRLAIRLERGLQHRDRLRIEIVVLRDPRAPGDRGERQSRQDLLHRLIDGASKTPPLAFRARNMVSAIEAGETNSSSGKRCCRKQSLRRHWNDRSSPCETRYAGHEPYAR